MTKLKSESQIVAILQEAEAGLSVQEICRKYAIRQLTFYKWREQYGDMEASDVKHLKELEDQNGRLKQMYIDLSLHAKMQPEIIKKL